MHITIILLTEHIVIVMFLNTSSYIVRHIATILQNVALYITVLLLLLYYYYYI